MCNVGNTGPPVQEGSKQSRHALDPNQLKYIIANKINKDKQKQLDEQHGIPHQVKQNTGTTIIQPQNEDTTHQNTCTKVCLHESDLFEPNFRNRNQSQYTEKYELK